MNVKTCTTKSCRDHQSWQDECKDHWDINLNEDICVREMQIVLRPRIKVDILSQSGTLSLIGAYQTFLFLSFGDAALIKYLHDLLLSLGDCRVNPRSKCGKYHRDLQLLTLEFEPLGCEVSIGTIHPRQRCKVRKVGCDKQTCDEYVSNLNTKNAEHGRTFWPRSCFVWHLVNYVKD